MGAEHGPISEMKTGSRRRSRGSRRPARGGLLVLDVLDDPAVGAGLVALPGVVAQALERAGPGADPLDRGDLLLQGEDRLDLQRRADPGAGAADPAAPAQVLEGVDREPHLQLLARLLGTGEDGVAVAARRPPRRRPPAPRTPSRRRPSASRRRGSAPRPCPRRSAARAPGRRPRRSGNAGGDVDRDDLTALVEQRLVDGEEVPDRGLGRRRPALGGAQALVEARRSRRYPTRAPVARRPRRRG